MVVIVEHIVLARGCVIGRSGRNRDDRRAERMRDALARVDSLAAAGTDDKARMQSPRNLAQALHFAGNDVAGEFHRLAVDTRGLAHAAHARRDQVLHRAIRYEYSTRTQSGKVWSHGVQCSRTLKISTR